MSPDAPGDAAAGATRGPRHDSSRAGTRRPAPFAIWVVMILSGLAAAAASSAGQIYRWTDEDGSVHYSDKIPPAKVDRGHTKFTDTGVAVEDVPAVKTPEERRREEALERLRRQQQRLIEQQTVADNRLLRTYRSVDDLVMARNGQLAGIDAVIGVARNHIRRQQDWLMDLYAQAADLERAGTPVPGHLRSSIANAEESIRDAYARILKRERQKQEIRESFARDLKRYRKLVGLPKGGAADQGKETADAAAMAELKNLVACADRRECQALWQRAAAFVRSRSTTPVHTAGENLIVTAAPSTPQDISLILTRIEDKDGLGATLFLDVQCLARRRDTKGCHDPRAEALLDEYHRVLTETPAATSATAGP